MPENKTQGTPGFPQQSQVSLPNGPGEPNQRGITSTQDMPPRIAVTGQAGVGKTSTINALFGTKEKVSDVFPGTLEPKEVNIQLQEQGETFHAPRGEIVVIDMPGLGERRESDPVYLDMYARVLPTVDVMLWIADTTRALAATQGYLNSLKKMVDPAVFAKIVFSVNKVDAMQPGEWRLDINAPDAIKQENIKNQIKLVSDVLGVPKERVVAYSALKRYNLYNLLNALLQAVPLERRVVLTERVKVADSFELIDPDVKKLLMETLMQGGGKQHG